MTVFETWEEFFGALPPVAHALREPLRSRWLRIHSLSESKRYAETEDEYSEILTRQNAVASEILGFESRTIFFAHAWGNNEDFSVAFSEFDWAKSIGLPEASLVAFDLSEGDEHLVVGGCRLQWRNGGWNGLIRDVADDRLGSVVLLNPASGEIYAPYDGGADVFLNNAQRTTELRDRWAPWLSKHPRGL
jgi:hypothetical protein